MLVGLGLARLSNNEKAIKEFMVWPEPKDDSSKNAYGSGWQHGLRPA